MAQATAREQLMLELINRARLDPAAEAARLGIALNQGLPAGTIDATSKAPLAMNALLIDSARAHSQWMINTDTFNHTGVGGSSPGDRMEDAGYVFSGTWRWGENISYRGISGLADLTNAIVAQHDSLFLSSGHRTNILEDQFVELGIGQIAGDYNGFSVSMVTQNFAVSGPNRFVTGVAYTDLDQNKFYSVGEAAANVKVTVGASSMQTAAAGGYQVVASAGVQTITFDDGQGLARVQATLVGENAKLDYVNSDTVLSSVSLTLLSGVTKATLLGLDNLALTGASTSDTLTGNKGANQLDGKAGNDTIKGGSGSDFIKGGTGADKLYGDTGNDTIYGEDDNDTLYGGTGNDSLYGGSGADRFSGSTGADKLWGGVGGDTFVYLAASDSTAAAAGRDTIFDFSRSQGDRFDLSLIDANSAIAGNQAFSFIGDAAFGGIAGQVRFGIAGGLTYVYADTNGDRKADFGFVLDRELPLNASDFLL